ncbi:rcc01693 family protein [Mesorhizobium sp. IMUNJ 23232]|uniref:rcc01693 family protein n=1 Tax=Mesorhizobium sp. IMUNJ 23232 TaxID=3376064 RepID=UPI0037ADD6F6
MTAAAGRDGGPSPEAFPWDTVMALGFGLLRLSPKDFWTMTPREFERAMSFHRGAGDGGPRRRDLAAMMAAFPDAKAPENG